MTSFLGILANLSLRLKIAFKVDAMHTRVFTDIALYYLFFI